MRDAEAADDGRLRGLQRILGTRRTALLTTSRSLPFLASFPWGGHNRRQWVRASEELYSGEWWDHVEYRIPGSETLHHGRAALTIKAVDGVMGNIVVVQRLRPAPARSGCVLTKFGRARLRWAVPERSSFPSLAAVPVEYVRRLQHVVPDFEDLCARHGLFTFPGSTPETPRERILERFLVNFYAWTSNGLGMDKTA